MKSSVIFLTTAKFFEADKRDRRAKMFRTYFGVSQRRPEITVTEDVLDVNKLHIVESHQKGGSMP